MEYQLILHVKDVIDRGELLSDLPVKYLIGEGVDLSHKHTFKTWCGKVDGTGPGVDGFAACYV